MASTLPGVLLLAAVVLGFLAMTLLLTRDRDRQPGWERDEAELRRYAGGRGWQPLDRLESVPAVVADAGTSPSCRLLMVRPSPGPPVWLCWHVWQEANPSAEGGWIISTRVLTRYFLPLIGAYPAMSVRRRATIGRLLGARRGAGTGDAEFDRSFVVAVRDGTGPAVRLTAGMRRALLAGFVPPWSIVDGTLMTAYQEPPTPQNLEPRAAAIRRLAALLDG